MSRWIMLFGRGGTILISVGCAMLLVSLIPSAPLKSFQIYGHMEGRTWRMPYSERVLTPQEELSINLVVNETIKTYLLEVNIIDIIEWMRKKISMESTTDPQKIYQEEHILEYLEANPHVKVSEEIIAKGETILKHVPAKITNVTLVLHNPNPNTIEFNIKIFKSRIMAPKARLQSAGQIIVPLGLALTIPRIIVSLQTKKKKNQI